MSEAQAQQKPAGLSWDDESNHDQEGDFLLDGKDAVEAAPVPQACSIDNPDCEACQ
ncbi:hypothetical protein ACYPKM_01890 [Pseudomonas aeruginosa]